MITSVQEEVLRDVDEQHQNDQGITDTADQMPPQNLSIPPQHQQHHTEQQMSHTLVDDNSGINFGMADQHSSHLEHAHALMEHASHSLLAHSEAASSLEHLAGGGHSSQPLADITSGRASDQSLEAIAASDSRRHLQSRDRISGVHDGSNQTMRQINGNDREISSLGGSSGNTSNNNGVVSRPMSRLDGGSLIERQSQPMRNLTPVGRDGRGGQNGGNMVGNLTSDGRGSVGHGSGVGSSGNGLQDPGGANSQPLNFSPDQASQNILDSVSSASPLGRPPSMGGSQHDIRTIEQQHHGIQSLPHHMRRLLDHSFHSHPSLMNHLSQQQRIGGDSSSNNHNGRSSLSAFGLDNGNEQMHSRPGSTLLSEANSHGHDRATSHQTTSLIEETISAVAAKFSKSLSDAGTIPGQLPPSTLSGLSFATARSSSAVSHLGHGGDESLIDLVGRHQAHNLSMLSDRMGQSLSGMVDENSMTHSPGHSHGRELEKTHPCLTCLKLFRSKQQLAQHNLVHTGIRKHVCSFCDRAFKQLSHLQQHVRIHTGERKYMCKFCERGFKQMSHLQKHTRIHTGERKYICSICEKGFKQLSHLQQHFRIHTDERKYICSCCERGFKQLSHLQQHYIIHTGERKYVCQICNRAFKQMTHLQQHHRIHTGERKYVCQICNRAFKQMTHLQQHHVIHTGERKYVCQVCNRAFKQMTHLQQHHRIHTGERKYVCQICNRAFKQLTHLQKHHVIHTGERKYVCQCCDRAFKQLTHLQQHYRIHTDERKYVCQCCDRAFRQKSHLNQHFRIHMGEKPYQCKFENCERAFAQLSNLQHHMRNHDDQVKKEATRIHKCHICHRCYTNESSLKSHTLKMHINTKPIDQHTVPTLKKKRKRKNKDLYGGAPTMVPVATSDGSFSAALPEMKPSSSRPRSPTSSDEDDDDDDDDDEIIFVGEHVGPSRLDNFGGAAGSLGVQGQMLHSSGERSHDLNHQIPFSGAGNFSRGADPLALLASANRFTLQDNMISSLGGALNSFSDQLALRDAALLNSRFGDLRGSSQGAGFDDRFSSSNFSQQPQRDRDGFGDLNEMNSRGNSGNSSSSGGGDNDNLQTHNGNSSENLGQIAAHAQSMLRGGLGAGVGGMMHGAYQGSLGGLLKQIKQEPLDYFPPACHGSDQFAGMGVSTSRGFLSPQQIISSHLRGQLPSLNVPLIRDHFTHNQMLPHFSSASSSTSTAVSSINPSSTSSTSLASITPSSLVSLPLPLTHMGLYHQSHFSTSQRMGGQHPSPASTPSSQVSVGANLPSNQRGQSPLEQEDLRCFSPLRN